MRVFLLTTLTVAALLAGQGHGQQEAEEGGGGGAGGGFLNGLRNFFRPRRQNQPQFRPQRPPQRFPQPQQPFQQPFQPQPNNNNFQQFQPQQQSFQQQPHHNPQPPQQQQFQQQQQFVQPQQHQQQQQHQPQPQHFARPAPERPFFRNHQRPAPSRPFHRPQPQFQQLQPQPQQDPGCPLPNEDFTRSQEPAPFCADAQPNHHWNGKSYILTFLNGCNKFTGQQADEYCRRQGGRAVNMDTQESVDHFLGVSAQHAQRYYWTGGRINHQCGRVIWPSGRQEGWVRGTKTWSTTGGSEDKGPQPDNRDGNEICLAVLNNFYADGIKFHDVACHHRKPTICEMN